MSNISQITKKTAAVSLGLIFFLAPWVQGLYYPYQYLLFGLIGSALLVVLILAEKEFLFSGNKLFYALLAFFLVYFLSFLFIAPYKYNALLETLRYCFWLVFFYLGMMLKEEKIVKKLFLNGAFLLAAAGILSYFGLINLPGWVKDNRLYGSFQYANTQALYFLMALIISFFSPIENTKPQKFQKLFYEAIIFLAFVLTFSRGAFIVLFLLLFYFYWKKIKRKKTLLFIPVLLIFLGYYVVPHYSKLATRFITYTDALKVFVKHPLGIGPGEWTYQQFAFRSSNYYVKYLHNFFFQVGLDAGVLAVVLIFIMFFLAFKSFYREPETFAVTLVIFLHSFIDIDLLFGALGFFLMYLWGSSLKIPEVVNVKNLLKPVLIMLLIAFIGISSLLFQEDLITKKAYQAYNKGDLVKAWEMAKKGKELCRYNAENYLLQGLIRKRTGMPDAESYFKQGLKLNPDEPLLKNKK